LCKYIAECNNDLFHPAIEKELRREVELDAGHKRLIVGGKDVGMLVREMLHSV
jgi:hypothetical protein